MRIATIEKTSIAISKLPSSEQLAAAIVQQSNFEKILTRSKILEEFEYDSSEATPVIDGLGLPYFCLTYRKKYSSRYTAELTFGVKNGKVFSYSRIISQHLGSEPHCVIESEVRFYNIDGFAKVACQVATEQRVELMEDLGFSVSKPTLKKLVKSSGALPL